jgi:hypothetical protein
MACINGEALRRASVSHENWWAITFWRQFILWVHYNIKYVGVDVDFLRLQGCLMTGFSTESESCRSTHLSSGLTLQQRQQHVVTVLLTQSWSGRTRYVELHLLDYIFHHHRSAFFDYRLRWLVATDLILLHCGSHSCNEYRKILIFFSCGLHAEMFQIAKAPKYACIKPNACRRTELNWTGEFASVRFVDMHALGFTIFRLAQSAAVLGWLQWVMNSSPVDRSPTAVSQLGRVVKCVHRLVAPLQMRAKM